LKKISKFAVAGAIAFAAAAHAAPVSLTGTDDPVHGGSFTLDGTKDASFYVVLDPGTYTFSSSVDATDEELKRVWVSYTHNKNQGHKDDIFSLTGDASGTSYSGSFSDLVVTEPTKVYLVVDTLWGKHSKGGHFQGTLDITSAVPEPTTAALLLAGLGMMGFIGRRQRKNG